MGQNEEGDASNMMMLGQGGMGGDGDGGQSLDEIVSQNAKMIRRQSMPQQGFGNNQHNVDTDLRRISMMDFGNASPGGMGGFPYDPNGGMSAQHRRGQNNNARDSGDVNMGTSFGNNTPNYNGMLGPGSQYSGTPTHQQGGGGLDMGLKSPYLDNSVGMGMNFGVEDGNMNTNMGMYSQPQFNQTNISSPMNPSAGSGTPQTAGSGGMSTHGSGGSSMHSQYNNNSNNNAGNAGNAMRHFSGAQNSQGQDLNNASHGASRPSGLQRNSTGGSNANAGFPRQPQHPVPGSRHDRGMAIPGQNFDGINGPLPVSMNNYNPNNQNFPWETPKGGWPSTMVGRPHMNPKSQYKNAYSVSGFNMLAVLARVAARPSPEIDIGTVDLSCAFVVCDAEKDDFPIVYCSDNFERLTGYTKHAILGRNCRFLQSPDGNVQSGVYRKYVDDDSVLYLKNMINLRREAQISLINYRRGGQPFMNLLTIIPVTMDSDQVKYFVGFQVDLVEQPNAVTNRNADGSYSINYQRDMMPRYVMNAPESNQNKAELGQTISREDVSAILGSMEQGDTEHVSRLWDKVLLENTDDVIHVLSLKGLFQWVSPSAARVLEYEPNEIIGTALSSVCHPSDIVPVTRELKDTSTGASVNVVFRIRRKTSGYMWFEGHGSLHTEQGKGRKSIIMVGRERPVYTLSRTDINNTGGIGESELWTKMSTSGMFLFVSSNVRQLLDRQPDELIGISIQSLMRSESKTEFNRILEHARRGSRASVKHEMINRRGQVLSAYTTLYPGDATEGTKPTFVVAQTRMIRSPRGTTLSSSPYPHNLDRTTSADTSGSDLPQASHGGASDAMTRGINNPARYPATDGSAMTYAGQNGLLIGHQDQSLASEDNLFDELKTTKSSSWQYEIRQLEKKNRLLAEEVQSLLASKKKRKRRKGAGNQQKDCANCHTRVTPEWRRGPSGQRDLCNSCGLRWAKLVGQPSKIVLTDIRDSLANSLFLTTEWAHLATHLVTTIGKVCWRGLRQSLHGIGFASRSHFIEQQPAHCDQDRRARRRKSQRRQLVEQRTEGEPGSGFAATT